MNDSLTLNYLLNKDTSSGDNISLSLPSQLHQSFQQCKHQIIMSQPPPNQARLDEAFSKLFTDVRRNLEAANRDKFTQKLTQFRHTVRSFMTGGLQ